MLQFDHYTIRLMEADDAAAFYALIDENRPHLEAFFSGTVARTRTRADSDNYVSEIQKRIAEKTYYPYLIIDTQMNKIACFIDLKNIDWNLPKAELGCFIAAQYVQKGVSKKALLLLTNYYFKEMGFAKFFLRTHASNTAACKLAEGCGFEIEGILRKDYKTTSGELVDLVYYGKLA